MPQRIGVVLAGGAGRRMGGPKGSLDLAGRSLAERAALALWPACGSVLISVGAGAPNPAPGFEAIEDAGEPGRGPLAGIARAFEVTGTADLFVLACDYPRVDAGLVGALVTAAGPDDEVVMPIDGRGRDHPLVALWRRSTESGVRQALADGLYKVGGLMAELTVRRVRPAEVAGVDVERMLVNVNTPEDLAALAVQDSAASVPPSARQNRSTDEI